MIEGVVAHDDGAWFVTPFGRLKRADCVLPAGARATLSLRPEQIAVARDGDGVAGVVEDVAFRGETTQLRVGVAGRAALRVSASKGEGFQLGESVRLEIAPDAGVLFAETE